MNFVNKYNSIVGSIVLILTALFGKFWFLFTAYLLLNIIDWLSGWSKARMLKQESSKKGLKGIIKKVWYWVLILISFVTADIFIMLGNELLHIDLNYLVLIGWWTLACLLVNELRSITENLVELGVNVPEIFIKGLAITDKLINSQSPINESSEIQ
jgi:toxin secretion/phage lysis holin